MVYDEEALAAHYAEPPEDVCLGQLDLSRLPRHLSIIMDGNGRWAEARGLERGAGHMAGVDALRETITTCVRLGIDVLSAYAFSTENWRRPEAEVNMLMHLFATTLVHELPLFHQEDVRLVFLGDLEALPEETQEVFREGLEATADHRGMVLALAVNYGSRAELARAARLLAQEVAQGTLRPEDVTPEAMASHLYTVGLPDVDLLVRTSGEMRLSNYLLWQIAYAEFYVTPVLWPDFDRWELLRALVAYQGRERRFGGVVAHG